MFDLRCVVSQMCDRGQDDVAQWLVENRANYLTILTEEFSAWLERNPSPRESLAQRVARETGLEVIVE